MYGCGAVLCNFLITKMHTTPHRLVQCSVVYCHLRYAAI